MLLADVPSSPWENQMVLYMRFHLHDVACPNINATSFPSIHTVEHANTTWYKYEPLKSRASSTHTSRKGRTTPKIEVPKADRLGVVGLVVVPLGCVMRDC